MPVHPQIARLLAAIELEEKEQVKRFSFDQQHTLKSLKAEGLALHPINVTRKNFGYADYPEISFRLNYPAETNLFREGIAIECFFAGEEPVRGLLISLDGKSGEFRLFAPDFPDWIEDNGVGIKLAPDQRTTSIMKTALRGISEHPEQYKLFEKFYRDGPRISVTMEQYPALTLQKNEQLNDSQQHAVAAILGNPGVVIVHGPPGTGKTTTLIEAVVQLVRSGEKVLVAAPSNTAVDHIALGLVSAGLHVLRVGNTSKVDDRLFMHTPEGRLVNSRQQKEIKALKIRAEQFRKIAIKYKRSFGAAEREQRSLLFKEVKNIRAEIKNIQAYNEEKLYADAAVVLATPIGLYDSRIRNHRFQTLLVDEAGQCMSP